MAQKVTKEERRLELLTYEKQGVYETLANLFEDMVTDNNYTTSQMLDEISRLALHFKETDF